MRIKSPAFMRVTTVALASVAASALCVSIAGLQTSKTSLAPVATEPPTEAPSTQTVNMDDTARVVWHFVEPGIIGTAHEWSDYSDLMTSFVYEPITSTADGSVQWKGNRYPDIVDVSTDAMRWCVMTDYASSDAYGGPAPKEVTDKATYDPNTGIITMPKEFAGADLTLIWYVEGTEGDKLVPYDTVVTKDIDGKRETTVLTKKRRADSKSISVHVCDENETEDLTLTGTAEGVALSDFVGINGDIDAIAPAMGPSLTIYLSDGKDVTATLPTAVEDADMSAFASRATEPDVYINEVEELAGTAAQPASAAVAASDDGIMTAQASAFTPTVGYTYNVSRDYPPHDSENSDYDKNTAVILGYPEKNKKYGFLTHFYAPCPGGPDLTKADINHVAPGGWIITLSGGRYDRTGSKGTHWIWGECAGDVANNGPGLHLIVGGWVRITGINYSTGICTWDYFFSVISRNTNRKQQSIVGSFQTKEDLNGWIKIKKKPEEGTLTNNNPQYRIAGAVYGIYNDSACTSLKSTLTVNADGVAKSGDLPANKTFYIKEISTPRGFKPDEKVYNVTVKSGQTVEVAVDGLKNEGEIMQVASLTITKTSEDPGTLDNQYYSFDGIQYTLLSEQRVAGTNTPRYKYVITLGQYGAPKSVVLYHNGSSIAYSGKKAPYIENVNKSTGTIKNMVIDTYTLQETKDNSFYYLDPKIETIVYASTTTGNDPNTKSTTKTDKPRYGAYVLLKTTADTDADVSDFYNFENCQYELVGQNKGRRYVVTTCHGGYAQHGLPANYSSIAIDAPLCKFHNSHAAPAEGVFNGREITLANGQKKTVYGDILYDTYTVKEIQSNKYYKLNPTPWSVQITSGATSASENPKKDTTKETPQYCSVKITKRSTDKNTEGREPYYDFSGITYRLTSENVHKGPGRKDGQGHLIYDVTLDAKGNGTINNMVFDKYSLTEVASNKYYQAKDGIIGQYRIDAANTVSGTQTYLVSAEDEPNTGTIKVVKKSTSPSSEDSPFYSFEGIVYQATSHGIYENGKPKTYRIPLNADGVGEVSGCYFDTYDIEEIETNIWYERDYKIYKGDAVLTAEKTHSGDIPVEVSKTDEPVGVRFQVNKATLHPGLTFDNGAYSLAGAQFEVKNSRTGLVEDTIVTNHLGYGISKNVPYDDYVVTEKVACLNHVISGQPFTFPHETLTRGRTKKIGENGADIISNDAAYLVPSFDFVKKIDKESNGTDSPGESTLAGAVYKIDYYDITEEEELADNPDMAPKNTWYLKTDENGHTDFQSVEPGDMTVTTKQNGKTVTKTFTSSPVYTKRNDPNTKVIPCGVFTIQEVLNPEGRVFDNASAQGPGKKLTYTVEVDRKQPDPQVSCEGLETTSSEPVVRGDLQFLKLDEVSGKPMSGIPFVITAKATGEKHVVTTNADGICKVYERYTAAPDKANANDKLLSTNDADDYVLTDESALDHSAGVFFTGYGPKNDPDGSKAQSSKPSTGAYPMPYGWYEIQELPCAKNHARTLERAEVEITDNDNVHVIGDVIDKEIAIRTLALDKNLGLHAGSTVSDDDVVITDEVSYTNLTPGRQYTMSGTLMDKATGKELVGADNKTFTASKTFIADDKKGTVLMEFTVPMSVARGKAIVVYEKLRDSQRDLTEHQDPNDEKQTVRYPTIKTNAVDAESGTHDGFANQEEITIKDTVTYTNLVPGETYTMKATLMDKATKAPITDDDGQPITGTQEFIADEANGSVDVSITVKRDLVAGKLVVAYEQVSLEGNVIAVHEDIDDEDQTVSYPKIQTTATDRETSLHEGYARETAVLDDVVEYTNLLKGKTYEIRGVLMDKETGEPLLSAENTPYESSVTFIADDKDGYVLSRSVEEPQEGDESANETENVQAPDNDEQEPQDAQKPEQAGDENQGSSDDGQGAPAEDANDEGEPSGDAGDDTTDEPAKPAIPEMDGTRVNGKVTVSFVFPGDVIAGKTTVVFETLYDGPDDDGETPPDGDEPGNPDEPGEPDTPGEPDEPGSPDEPKEIYKHEDLDDEEQSVSYPKIGTTATADGGHVAEFSEKTTLVDVVSYQNLIPGQRYIAEGIVMSKNTESPLIDDEGNEVTSSVTFTPDEPNGEVVVEFEFSSTSINSTASVVFEKVYKVIEEEVPVDEKPNGDEPSGDEPSGDEPGADEPGDDKPDKPVQVVASMQKLVLIASHEDLDDEGQTVFFRKFADYLYNEEIADSPTPMSILEAGDVILYGLGAIALCSGGAYIALHRRRNHIPKV